MTTFYIEQVAAYNHKQATNPPEGVVINCSFSILQEFKKLLAGSAILGATYVNPYTSLEESIPEHVDMLTSRHLQILARNEKVNVDGIMNTSLYNGLLSDDQIARLRCLVKATTISGVIYATHTGGFRAPRYQFREPTANILIDQAGLQWQGDYRNTGGMHFYPNDINHKDLPEGYRLWQQEMYKAMYGIERASSASVNNLLVRWGKVEGTLDLNSVSNALAVEFSQALDACVTQGNLELHDDARINFKFCRAGMGFFSSGLTTDSIHKLRVARLEGIERALQYISTLSAEEQAKKIGKIGRIVFPNSNEAPYSDEVLGRIELIVKYLGIEWGGAPHEDAFKPVSGYINATTNCADPHAMPGNEGGPCSVDACIAYNANINNHIAAYNSRMQLRASEEFIFDIPVKQVEVRQSSSSLSDAFVAPDAEAIELLNSSFTVTKEAAKSSSPFESLLRFFNLKNEQKESSFIEKPKPTHPTRK